MMQYTLFVQKKENTWTYVIVMSHLFMTIAFKLIWIYSILLKTRQVWPFHKCQSKTQSLSTRNVKHGVDSGV